ncbi:ThiF family adenylyltransferase [Ornithinibacillus sp. BX22]|uniref:ThiF family adenylyltransferase n=2 Tax=Ornithinibacillus TaxID=484508 RepID=A0A923RJG5_9BACI|nr:MULTISPECIES: MoeB/ThiF family adenylyltransferase [Ornithinibacillus]MBC5637403.1 ThiF family adenylyltransferase [Ornithinibacillus hominis]MBS3680289.1 ThiF family adenylyltransferase [Ornithinibacillus massiliensis]
MKDRYSRQELYKPIGVSGQKKIQSKHVLIIGCGALGTMNAESLVRAGIGRLSIVDRDYVEISNLQRQQLFTEEDCLKQLPKAIAAKEHLLNINSSVTINAYVMDGTSSNLPPLMEDVDLVIDATDNFDIRFVINDLIHQYTIPWIFGSCVGSTGMSYTIVPQETPCLQCLLDATPASGATCDSVGVISPAVQMVVALQQAEALKILVEDDESLRTKLVTFDLWNNMFHTMDIKRAKKNTCPTCGENPIYPKLTYESQTKMEVLCGRNTVQVRSKREVHMEELARRLSEIGTVHQNDFLLSVDYHSFRVVIFKDGRVLIHGTNSIEQARNIYYQLVG